MSPKRTRWKMSVTLLCTASLGLWLGCSRGPSEYPEGSLDLSALPGGCEKAATCGDFVGVDCGSAVDGPYYYVRRDTGKIIQICGGACMSPERKPGVCEQCPPAEWTCGN